MQVVDSKLSLDTAMSFYGLEHSKPFREKIWDTKLLLAWNRNAFVVARVRSRVLCIVSAFLL